MRLPPAAVRHLPFVLMLAILASASSAGPTAGDGRLGFLRASGPAQDRAEAAFLATPTPERASRWLHELTEEPHVAGTEGGRRTAERIRDHMREFGIDAQLVRYDVLLNHPVRTALRLVEPWPEELSLFERGDLRDKDSFSRDAFPAFHGYGAAGRASGQVVYANYGTEEDFRRLDGMGIEVAGRIVLARYGRIFRGLKVRAAQERGAAGVVLFSDPADDGYMKGDIYPDGPMRPPSALQRGSVQFLSLGPGDPQTPGVASTAGAERIPRESLDGIPRIPSLPLAYGEAEKILRALAGPRVPDEWQGGLPFAYHVGPGAAKVEMEVEMDYAVRPIFNVLGRIEGTAEPDRWVILGNHHDAWTYGAVDPSSGTASLLEAARGLGAAVAAGWRPRRSVLLASWDAEEYGLVGSTEWGEDLAAELGEKAVAYLNLDSSVTGGDLEVSGIPSLRDLVLEVAGTIGDPVRGRSVGDLWQERLQREWAQEEPIPDDGPDARFVPHLGPLGSGSDYTVFVDHLGIAALDFGFRGSYGVYHSTLDNYFWMRSFGDPQFLYHAVAARFLGLLAMRLASADLVPLRYAPYADDLDRHLRDLRRKAVREARDAAVAERPPERPALQPDLAPLRQAVGRFREAAASADAALDRLQDGAAAPPEDRGRLSDALVGVERRFLSPGGLPGRPWFRHLLYAPGLTTGYASWPFPGLAQAIRDHDAALWEAQEAAVRERLAEATRALEEVARLAGGGPVGEGR